MGIVLTIFQGDRRQGDDCFWLDLFKCLQRSLVYWQYIAA